MTHLWYWKKPCKKDSSETGVNPDARIRDLTDDEVNKLREVIDKLYCWETLEEK